MKKKGTESLCVERHALLKFRSGDLSLRIHRREASLISDILVMDEIKKVFFPLFFPFVFTTLPLTRYDQLYNVYEDA